LFYHVSTFVYVSTMVVCMIGAYFSEE